MRRLLLSLAWGTLFLLPLAAQQKSELKPLPPIPQDIILRFFFHTIGFLEDSAARETAAGRDGSKARTEIQRMAHLNDTETAILKRVALTCNAQETDFQTRNTARASELTSRGRGNGIAAENAKREMAQLNAAREKIVTDCVSELKTALGEKRFGQLHAFAEAFVKPRLSISEGKADGSDGKVPGGGPSK